MRRFIASSARLPSGLATLRFVRLGLALCAAAGAASIASAQPSVGVSIGINQPGVYGRINIGDVPPPALVLPQPVIIAPPPVRYERRPIYLYVPPFEQQNWPRFCNRYAACGQPVYFVREDWVRDRYIHEHPEWARRHPDRGDFRDHGRPGPDRRDGHDDRGGRGWDHDRHERRD